MIDPFAKAERWRRRAVELRVIAQGMHERDARASLFAIAGGLEDHARSLEDMAVALHCITPVFREEATAPVTEAAD